MKKIKILGAGLAGSEACLQIAGHGFDVEIYEMRDKYMTGAHKTNKAGELVCSNSLGSFDETVASGLLKAELKILNSYLINFANEFSVPAGNCLAVDREKFADKITEKLLSNPKIKFIRKKVTEISVNDDDILIIATGPLTSPDLTESIINFTGEDNLNFFDAIAPIVEKSSIDLTKAFYMNRYNKGTPDYINCPMNKEEYDNFYNILTNSPKIELKDFEKKAKYFESCLPVEVLGSRGYDTLRFGPMKPVGLIDERTGIENYAVVQLRQDDKEAELYNLVGFQTNLKWHAQKEMVHSIPGLENANIVRYGVMHRNTFINSPKLLTPYLNLRKHQNIFFAGQITGTEGYTESIATGLFAGLNAIRLAEGKELLKLSSKTMLGSLLNYISFEGQEHFQPINSNWGIIDKTDIDRKILRNKKLKTEFMSKRAIEEMQKFKDINLNN